MMPFYSLRNVAAATDTVGHDYKLSGSLRLLKRLWLLGLLGLSGLLGLQG